MTLYFLTAIGAYKKSWWVRLSWNTENAIPIFFLIKTQVIMVISWKQKNNIPVYQDTCFYNPYHAKPGYILF